MRRLGPLAWLSLTLPVALLAVYGPALNGAVLWDDDAHVTRPALRSLQGLWSIWTRPGATQQYYPVLHSAFWLEHLIWGDAPLGYHLLNLALHAVLCLLLFCVLRRLSVPGAVLAVAAFALHPVCAESVAWISEQKNTLSGVFYMAAALCYLRFDAGRLRQWYVFGTALFVLALLSKSVTATLPAALLVALWWKKGRLSPKRDVAPLIPWFLLSAGAGALTAWVERTYIGAQGGTFELTLLQRFLVAGHVAWFYLEKIFWPGNLVSIYPRWVVDTLDPWQYLYPLSAVLVLAVLAFLAKKWRGPLATGLLFVGTLFPALGFINVYPFVFSYVADHFQYLAAAGMISSASAGAVLAQRRLSLGVGPGRVLSALLVGTLAGLTWRQSFKYRTQETFYNAILEKNPASWLAHDNLGIVLNQEGKPDQAGPHFLESMRLNPSYPEAFNNYGNLVARTGHWKEASEAYAGALRARPLFPAAEYNWGFSLNQAGRYAQAVPHFMNSIRMKSDFPEAHYELGNALANSDRVAEAMAEYDAALKLRPGYPEAEANLGLALAQEGRWQEAITHIQSALAARPGYAEAHGYLGFAFAGVRRFEEAVAEYKKCLALGPNNPDIHYNLGLALGQLGRSFEAQQQIDEARRLQMAGVGR
jgi:tetratricopeptide (TPR) repeat protein